MMLYHLGVIGRVAAEDKSVGRVLLQKWCSLRDIIDFMVVDPSWSKNGGWGGPEYPMKAKNEIFNPYTPGYSFGTHFDFNGT